VAGLCGMKRKKFFILDLLGSIIWSVSYLFVGYFFGQVWNIAEMWSSRVSISALFIIVFIVLIYALQKTIVKNFRRIAAITSSLWQSIKSAIISNPEVQESVARHPKFFNFFKKHLDKSAFTGRPLTYLLIIFMYVLFLLVGVVEGVITYDPIVEVDLRITNLLFAFRTVELVNFFMWVTILAKFEVVFVFALGFSVLLWIWRKQIYVIAMWVAIFGGTLLTYLGKFLIHRPRPEGLIPVYFEQFYSFPSSHATIAVIFYGFVMLALWKSLKSWNLKINSIIFGVVLIGLVGVSRIYLGVHFMSDVFGGYLLGLLWLLAALSIVEWHDFRKPKINFPAIRLNRGLSTAIVVILTLGFYILAGLNFHPHMNMAQSYEYLALVADPLSVFKGYQKSKYSEKLSGDTQAPLSIMILAKSDQELLIPFLKSKWYLADEISARSLYRIAQAAILNRSYLSAPMTPSFWDREVNDFGFEKPTATNSVRQRHHARFWKTDFVTADGYNIYVGTASLDIGMKWLVAHRIDPAIDVERDFILSDLKSTGLVDSIKESKFVQPTLGKNSAGDQFFTDGNVYIVKFK
jgi:membrane-associated phospholipid phosphatase